MYWDNPLIETKWPGQCDPVHESLHRGVHVLLHDPRFDFRVLHTDQRLADLSRWAMEWITQDGIDAFCDEPMNQYDAANLVKLNMWIQSMRQQGNVKPWLILDEGNGRLLAGTGDSRLRCLERLPEITTIPAFITTHQTRQHLYPGLESITSFDRFAELCGARQDQLFMFRLTDPEAPYGMYWYEYNHDLTRSVTPGQTDAVGMIRRYLHRNPDMDITPEWFDNAINWDQYRSD